MGIQGIPLGLVECELGIGDRVGTRGLDRIDIIGLLGLVFGAALILLTDIHF